MISWFPARAATTIFAVCCIIAIAITLAYSAGLHGPFVFDDISNITHNPAIAISNLRPSSLYTAAVSGSSSTLGRPLATLSFAVNYFIAGGLTNTFAFKLVNLVIHIANTALVYWFVLLLLRQAAKTHPAPTAARWVPTFTAALWGLHPLNLTSVLYVVQRMTSLSALFVLLGMILFLYGRQRVDEQRRRGMTLILCGWSIGLVFGTAAKETAVLILLYIPLTEYLFFSGAGFRADAAWPLRAFYGFAIVLPLLTLLVWVLTHPQFVQGPYAVRHFDMTQRLLTEPRVLWFYLHLLFVPDATKFSLYHDDIPISSGLFMPWTTVPAILSLLALAAAALLGRKRHPISSFAVLWFLVGHLLESSFLPLEIAHEHRNYLPVVGPLFAVAYAIGAVLSDRPRALFALSATLAVALASVTFLRAQTWASEEQLITTMARYHPRSARAQAMLAELLAIRKGDLIQARRHYEMAAALDPDEATYPIRMCVNSTQASFSTNTGGTIPEPARPEAIYAPIPTWLHKRIKDDLSRKAPTPMTISTLGDLASSIQQAPRQYHGLYPYAVEWYRSALKNPEIPHEAHKAISIYLFRASMAQMDYSVALETAINARSYDPTDLSCAWMEIDARIALHQLNQAEQILSHVASASTSFPPDVMNDITVLRAKIRTARADSSAHGLHTASQPRSILQYAR